MMLKLFIVISLATMCLSLSDKDAQIIMNTNKHNEDGSYNYRYDASNGISVQEAGVGGIASNGAIQWVSPEGIPIQLIYSAGPNGYQVEGNHLPTPHPIPEYILESIEFNRKEAEKRAKTKSANDLK